MSSVLQAWVSSVLPKRGQALLVDEVPFLNFLLDRRVSFLFGVHCKWGDVKGPGRIVFRVQ
jgi:hypothetical protein